jgi:alpha-tubulin suppressor-like RCC1 family protein
MNTFDSLCWPMHEALPNVTPQQQSYLLSLRDRQRVPSYRVSVWGNGIMSPEMPAKKETPQEIKEREAAEQRARWGMGGLVSNNDGDKAIVKRLPSILYHKQIVGVWCGVSHCVALTKDSQVYMWYTIDRPDALSIKPKTPKEANKASRASAAATTSSKQSSTPSTSSSGSTRETKRSAASTTVAASPKAESSVGSKKSFGATSTLSPLPSSGVSAALQADLDNAAAAASSLMASQQAVPVVQLQGYDIKKLACAANGEMTYMITQQGHLYSFDHNTMKVTRLLDGHVHAQGIATSDIIDVACGQNNDAPFTVVCNARGEVYTWGENNKANVLAHFNDKKANKDKEKDSSHANSGHDHVEMVKGLEQVKVVNVSAGHGHILVLSDNGDIWGWGFNEQGAVGVGDRKNHATPVRLESFTRPIDIANTSTSIAITAAPPSAALSPGASTSKSPLQSATSPVPDNHDSKRTATPESARGHHATVATTIATTAATTATGGGDVSSSIATPPTTSGGRPISRGPPSKRNTSNVNDSSTRTGTSTRTSAATTSGTGTGAGKRGSGGKVNTDVSSNYVVDPVISVVCGTYHSLALTRSGILYSWGRGADLALGLGQSANDIKDHDRPTRVTGISSELPHTSKPSGSTVVTHQAAAAAAVATPSSLGGGGSGGAASIGLPSFNECRIISIGGGGRHSLALTSTGLIWSWGRASRGVLGHANDIDDIALPRIIDAARTTEPNGLPVMVTAAGIHSVALFERLIEEEDETILIR